MEATGVDWKPVWPLLESGFDSPVDLAGSCYAGAVEDGVGERRDGHATARRETGW
jgi:hypothetical protein